MVLAFIVACVAFVRSTDLSSRIKQLEFDREQMAGGEGKRFEGSLPSHSRGRGAAMGVGPA